MKVTVTAPPKLLTVRFPSVKKIAEDKEVMDYAKRMKEFIFGKETLYCTKLMEMNPYNLIFIKNTPFREYILRKIEKIDKEKKETVAAALLINALYFGKQIRIVPLRRQNDIIVIGELTLLRLSIIDTCDDYDKRNKKLSKIWDRNYLNKPELNKRSQKYLETIRMGAVCYYMRRAISEKEFMEKINYRRFSTNLRLNNRPADIKEINDFLNKRRYMTFIDLTDSSSRVYLSALYMIAFKGGSLEEIYDTGPVFSAENKEESGAYSTAASEFIDIIYNGNGIEISDILVKMAESFAKIKLPDIKDGSLIELMDNFTEIYVIAAVAYKFDKAFSEHEMLKSCMRRSMAGYYWTIYSNILQFKKFGSVVSFCYNLAETDLNKYRDDVAYSDELTVKFSEAERIIKEIKSEVNEL